MRELFPTSSVAKFCQSYGTKLRYEECLSHNWYDRSTGIVVLIEVDRSRAFLLYNLSEFTEVFNKTRFTWKEYYQVQTKYFSGPAGFEPTFPDFFRSITP